MRVVRIHAAAAEEAAEAAAWYESVFQNAKSN